MIYVRGVFLRIAKSTISACEMAYIVVRKAPYRTLKWAFSYCETGNIIMRNGLFRALPTFGVKSYA